MKNIVPNGDLPPHVQPVKFGVNEEMREAGIQDAYAIVHYPEHLTDPSTHRPENIQAIELMFEVTQDEITTLMHEPYITLTLLTDQLPPVMMQTSYPYDPRYKLMVEHHHRCPLCEEHWRCDNPKHKMPESRKLVCTSCWHKEMDEAATRTSEQVDVDDPDTDEVE